MGPEVVVGLCLERSVEMVVGSYGRAQGREEPICHWIRSIRWRGLSYMLEDAEAGVGTYTASIGGTSTAYLDARIVCLDEEMGEDPRGESESEPESGVIAENLAYVIYTSGSTGKTERGHGSRTKDCAIYVDVEKEAFGSWRSKTRVLQFASLSFDASVWEIFWRVSGGRRSLHICSQEGRCRGGDLERVS